MRAGRLVALLLCLQQRSRTTAADLAAELEVSVRTIYRDVSALQQAGVPLWTETGPAGGIRLLDGWRTTLDGLTADEAGALLLGGAPDAAADLGLGTVLVAAQTKVLATLPPELRSRATRVRQRFHLDAPGWFHHDEAMPHLAALATAVWDDRTVDIGYRRRDRDVSRRVDPLGLVVKAGVWYLVARPAGGSDIRTYRVSRITRCEAGGDHFDRPSTFDLAGWWRASANDFDSTILRERVTLRLSPSARRLLPHVVGPGAAEEALTAATAPDAEGWVTVDLAVEAEEVAHQQLTGLGAGVEVIAPLGLRAAMAATGAAMAARNGVLDAG